MCLHLEANAEVGFKGKLWRRKRVAKMFSLTKMKNKNLPQPGS